MARRSYDKQFKMAAVKLVLEDNIPISEVSKELSIHYNSLYRWISEYEEYGEVRSLCGASKFLMV